MRVFVACEYSGIVRRAFRAAGHDAWSCDLLDAEDGSPHHIKGDALAHLHGGWDLLIAHPPCTRLTLAGVRWLHERELWSELDRACEFFRAFLSAPIPLKAVENPLPHRYATERIGRSYSQRLQPWQFGHGETKGICLWLDGLPPLTPTCVVPGRVARVHRMPPGPFRAHERSRFFSGVADAMAAQWGAA